MKRNFFLQISLLFFSATLTYPQITFSNPILNSQSEILFSVTHNHSGEISYSTLFSANLNEEKSEPCILTAFPEQMGLLSNGKTLRLKNRYGISQYSLDTGILTHTNKDNNNKIPSESVLHGAESISPDGKWICNIEKKGPASGKVIIRNASGYTETILIPELEFSYTEVPVKWSADSSLLIYEKEGILYFTEPDAMFKTSQIPEYLRKIGPGSINSVYWASDKKLIYITNDLVYSIPINEMYTRALYSDFMGIGTIIGRLPFSFDSSDTYSVNTNCNRMFIAKANGTFYYMRLPGNPSFNPLLHTGTEIVALGETSKFQIFWDGLSPIIWIEKSKGNEITSKVFKLEQDETSLKKINLSTPNKAQKPILSPNKEKVLFTDKTNVFVYSISQWKQLYNINYEPIISYLWNDSDSIYLGGEYSVSKWELLGGQTGTLRFLFPSSANNYSWNPDNNNPVVFFQEVGYEYEKENSTWKKSDLTSIPKSTTGNNKYRVFLGTSPNADFTNAPYVRYLTGPAITKILYTPAALEKKARPKVALSFDATDNADGLAAILHTLNKYNIQSTFFINGEFLRRYPDAAIQIATENHECASMFYTATDLLNSEGFIVDEAFIRQGLARNEDEFFATTGYELALLWHAPYYKANQKIIKGGQLAGYTYIGNGFTAADTITLEAFAQNDVTYLSSAEIIEKIIRQLKDKAVIPVAVGINNGTRSDYLYNKLDLLIGAILDAGYDIVTVGNIHLSGLPVAEGNPQK